MERGVGRPGLAVEAADAVMRLGAGLLAIVAAHAQRFVDQQHVGRLAEPLAQEIDEDAAPDARGWSIVAAFSRSSCSMRARSRVRSAALRARTRGEGGAVDLDRHGFATAA